MVWFFFFLACRASLAATSGFPERVAAVDKIEEKRKPEDFIGHRNRGAKGALPVADEAT